jgi:hypothetical protein
MQMESRELASRIAGMPAAHRGSRDVSQHNLGMPQSESHSIGLNGIHLGLVWLSADIRRKLT